MNQFCTFCVKEESIISKDTCCTSCSRLTMQDIENLTFEEMKIIMQETEKKLLDKFK